MKAKQLKRNTVYKIIGAAMAATIINACSDDTSSTTSGGSDSAFSGPGSKWNFDLAANGTFSIERSEGFGEPVDMTIGGTYSRLDSGFMKLIVGESTGSDAPAAGDEAWALEIPGYALLVKPMEAGSDQMIAMVASGTCPVANFNANWILVKQDVSRDASDPTSDYTGTFSYDATTGVPGLPARYSITDPTTNLGAGTLSSGACADGILAFSQATLYLTNNGGAIVHTTGDDPDTEDDDNFIFALGQKAISSVSAADGDYVGLLFDETNTAGNKVQPVSMTCVSGACNGNGITDIDTGATDVTDTITVSLTGTVDTPAVGMITGSISDGVNTGALTCMVDVNASASNKTIISCVGQSPSDSTKMTNVMFVSKG